MRQWPGVEVSPPLSVFEVLGLVPPAQALREAVRGLRGDPYTPGHAFDASSLKILEPRLSLWTWLGRTRSDRRAPIYNFFNREPVPDGAAFSVRKTFARDFMGGQRTYDGHKATDFVVPVGTPMVAAAPGRVARIAREFDRGGLHVCIDHGHGVFTTGSHLARALVVEGQVVKRGEVVALSGAAGLDFVATFPWNVPHIHYNVWLDSVPVDPFRAPGSEEISMWRSGDNAPVPHQGEPVGEAPPTRWDLDAVAASIQGCVDPALRATLAAIEDPIRQAVEVMFQRNYRPTRFSVTPRLYAERHTRQPLLDLPLRAEDFDGIIYEGMEEA